MKDSLWIDSVTDKERQPAASRLGWDKESVTVAEMRQGRPTCDYTIHYLRPVPCREMTSIQAVHWWPGEAC